MLSVLFIGGEPAPGVSWQALGCTPVGTSDGSTGLEEIAKLNLDVIFLDLDRTEGLPLLSRLRENGCEAQVILTASREDFSLARQGLWLGAVDYLVTPVDRKALSQAMERIRRRLTRIDPSAALPEGKSKYVREALGYIAQHYADTDISITTIADSLRLSEGHLSHMFKKETGTTVIGFLTQYRIRKAMELLRNCRYKVYEVAELVGYRDVTYFSSTFKKIAGMSPSEYQSKGLSPSECGVLSQTL